MRPYRILKYRKSNQNIQIHLWDTGRKNLLFKKQKRINYFLAGQERYKSITKQYIEIAERWKINDKIGIIEEQMHHW